MAIGAPPAVQVKLTVTFVLLHPAAFGWGVTIGVICGGVLEMFSVMCVDAVFPATSVAVPETT